MLPVNKIGFVEEITTKVQRSLKGFSSPGAMNFKGTAWKLTDVKIHQKQNKDKLHSFRHCLWITQGPREKKSKMEILKYLELKCNKNIACQHHGLSKAQKGATLAA